MDNQCKPERETKHMQLVAAVDRLRVVKNNTMRLCAEIGNMPLDKAQGVVETMPEESLLLVLSTAPEQIRSLADEIDKILEEIKEQLF